MLNSINGNSAGPPANLLKFIAEVFSPDVSTETIQGLIESAEKAFSEGNIFLAQHDAYSVHAAKVHNNDQAALPFVDRADEVLCDIADEFCPSEFAPGAELTYNGPIHIGEHLWIVKESDWPPSLKLLVRPEVGYCIVDLDSFTSDDDSKEFPGAKALRDGETVDIAGIIDHRISRDSAFPNTNIKIKRIGDAIKVLSNKEVGDQIKKLLDQGQANRIHAVKLSLSNQLEGDLTIEQRQQIQVDLIAIIKWFRSQRQK